MRIAEDVVLTEIHYRISMLVGTFVGGEAGSRCGDRAVRDLFDQAIELAAPIADYESTAEEAGFTVWGQYPRKAGACRRLCEHNYIEPYGRGVFEHWIVSDWLAEKLEAKRRLTAILPH